MKNTRLQAHLVALLNEHGTATFLASLAGAVREHADTSDDLDGDRLAAFGTVFESIDDCVAVFTAGGSE